MPKKKGLMDIFDDIKKEEDKQEYPPELIEPTRNRFIRQIFLNKYFLLIVLFLIIVILCILSSNNQIGFYSGLNKGIFLMNCGFEFVGNPGFFCGNY